MLTEESRRRKEELEDCNEPDFVIGFDRQFRSNIIHPFECDLDRSILDYTPVDDGVVFVPTDFDHIFTAGFTDFKGNEAYGVTSNRAGEVPLGTITADQYHPEFFVFGPDLAGYLDPAPFGNLHKVLWRPNTRLELWVQVRSNLSPVFGTTFGGWDTFKLYNSLDEEVFSTNRTPYLQRRLWSSGDGSGVRWISWEYTGILVNPFVAGEEYKVIWS